MILEDTDTFSLFSRFHFGSFIKLYEFMISSEEILVMRSHDKIGLVKKLVNNLEPFRILVFLLSGNQISLNTWNQCY